MRKFARTMAHRRALFRNLVTDLILRDRIKTTLAKAQDLRIVADRMITLGKKDDVLARKQSLAYLQSRDAMHRLFGVLVPRLRDRDGGYTRVVKTVPREHDSARMAYIEFVDAPVPFIPYPVAGVKNNRRTVLRDLRAAYAKQQAEAASKAAKASSAAAAGSGSASASA